REERLVRSFGGEQLAVGPVGETWQPRAIRPARDLDQKRFPLPEVQLHGDLARDRLGALAETGVNGEPDGHPLPLRRRRLARQSVDQSRDEAGAAVGERAEATSHERRAPALGTDGPLPLTDRTPVLAEVREGLAELEGECVGTPDPGPASLEDLYGPGMHPTGGVHLGDLAIRRLELRHRRDPRLGRLLEPVHPVQLGERLEAELVPHGGGGIGLQQPVDGGEEVGQAPLDPVDPLERQQRTHRGRVLLQNALEDALGAGEIAGRLPHGRLPQQPHLIVPASVRALAPRRRRRAQYGHPEDAELDRNPPSGDRHVSLPQRSGDPPGERPVVAAGSSPRLSRSKYSSTSLRYAGGSERRASASGRGKRGPARSSSASSGPARDTPTLPGLSATRSLEYSSRSSVRPASSRRWNSRS